MDDNHIGCRTCAARNKSIFKNLDTITLSQIEEVKTCKQYQKGELIFSEGAYPRGLFCIQSGKIKVTQLGADAKEQIVHLANDGDVMGYRALLGEDTFSCSAIALEDSKVCFIPKNEFQHLIESNGKLTLEIAHLLSDELKEAERKITHTAQQPVKNRIAQALLSLKQNYGVESDGVTINVAIKREELANLAGTTRETATRLLYELQEQKMIELVGKKIKLKNESLLLGIAHTKS
jgi:CRP/FNR family transcriptional regulator, polysaccharide utilization system transcription regulator